MTFFRNIKQHGIFVFTQICLSMAVLCSCNDADKDDIIIGGDEMAYFYPELICEIDAKGGRAVVEINPHVDYIAQFAYGTMHDLSEEYEYAAEVYEKHKVFICYPIFPFDFNKDDIINMAWLRANYPQYYWPVKDAEVELVDNPLDFDYQWIHVAMTQENVTVDAVPNPTGEDRRIILMFNPAPGDFNNVIEIRQLGV